MPKTIVITGASDGIGTQAARTLSAAGHQVVVVGRSPDKTRAAAAETGSEPLTADFAEPAQVRDLARALQDRYPRIDVLANNAGGVLNVHERTVDGTTRPSRSTTSRRRPARREARSWSLSASVPSSSARCDASWALAAHCRAFS